jgi:hypothetical protein
MKAVNKLCSRPYWTRLWIVQEVVLAQNLLIFCGTREVPVKGLTKLVHNSWFVTQGPINTRRTLGFLFADGKHNHFDSLVNAVTAFQNNQCQEPRDKVYGVRGLLPRHTQDKIEVDYSKSVEDVFFDAVNVMIGERSSLESWEFSSGVDALGKLMFPEQLGLADGWDFSGFFTSSRWKEGKTMSSQAKEDEWLFEKIKEYFDKSAAHGPGIYLAENFGELIKTHGPSVAG